MFFVLFILNDSLPFSIPAGVKQPIQAPAAEEKWRQRRRQQHHGEFPFVSILLLYCLSWSGRGCRTTDGGSSLVLLKDITRTQQQRPESPMVIFTWHESKVNTRYINSTKGTFFFFIRVQNSTSSLGYWYW